LSEPELFPLAALPYAIAPATAARLETFLHNRPANTAAAYRRELVDAIVALKKPIGDVDLADLQHYADELADRYRDPDGDPTSSVRHRLYVLKAFFKFAAEQRWISFNPAAALRVPKVRDRKDERILEEREVIRMIALADGRDRALLRTLYVAGVRVSELCRLRIRHVLVDEGRGELLVLGKGSKLNRIPVPASLYADLVRQAAGRDRDAPLFPGREHELPISRDGVLRIVKRCARAAGLTRIPSPHWLRHAHGTHADRNGAKVSQIQKTLGHADGRTTMGYLHPDPDDSSAFFIRG